MSPMAPKVRLLFLRILFTRLLFAKKIHLWNFLLTVPQMYDISSHLLPVIDRPGMHIIFLDFILIKNECSLISLYCYPLSVLDIFSAKRFYI